MSLRIAVGGIWHETNTFASEDTTLHDFKRYQCFFGSELVQELSDTATEPGGVISAARAGGAEIVPLVFAAALPSGPVGIETFEELAGELVERVQTERVDGVVLCLHGAMVVRGMGSPEAELARRFRSVVGTTPLGVTLDLHANIDTELADIVDILVGYTTYPHIDMRERGAEACRLVLRMIVEHRRPRTGLVKLPLLTPPHVQDTSDEPMKTVRDALLRQKADGSVWSASALPGFAFSDVDRLGFAVYVASDDDAAQRATSLAEIIWDLRASFAHPLLEVSRAVEVAHRGPAPTVLVDVGDNVGGGSPGDGTALLEAMLKQDVHGGLVVLWDPVAIADIYGTSGDTVSLAVGGHAPGGLGPPVWVSGEVRRPGAVHYRRTSSYATGQSVDMGRVALIDTDAVVIVLTENRIVPFDDDHLRVLGIDPQQRRIIVAKGAIAWKAGFGSYAAQSIYCNTAGCCPGDLRQVAYQRKRPLYPLDMRARWPLSEAGSSRSRSSHAQRIAPTPSKYPPRRESR